ncbi:MAG: tryptophan synthase subunit alpha [Desulfatibacillaceae bacterium]
MAKTFRTLADRNESALVGFVTAGDPDRHRSMEIIRAMCDNGVDILELGVPFSDPTADGPVIQRSSQRALKKGMNLAGVLEMVREIRTFSEVPVVVFSYYNPILSYGLSRFYDDATSVGADGVLVVDLPHEESDEMVDQWSGEALDLIRLVAPTTPRDRMKDIADRSSGFLYLVSMTGVTGSGGLNTEAVAAIVEGLKSVTDLPVAVGFGISTPEQVTAVARVAEGVVVGSAFERLIEENQDSPDLVDRMAEYTRSLKQATVR